MFEPSSSESKKQSPVITSAFVALPPKKTRFSTASMFYFCYVTKSQTKPTRLKY